MDWSKYQSLHTIIMLREVIRKWWRVELTFAEAGDPRGEPQLGAPLRVDGQQQGWLCVDAVPDAPAAEREKLRDLLQFAAQEISAYASAVKTHHEAIRTLSQQFSDRYRFENIVGQSAPMREIFRLLEKVSSSESTVLINGESGTGKELVARAIHFNGPRRERPFVVQNCSAFNDNLLESALFGHVKGSFTGALKDKKGLFELADQGTFFLDEVGDMSPTLQVKLLRVLQEGTFLPVGATTPKQVDVRVIAATHKDLSVLVKKGEFREDLFYRINVIRVAIPPLRERKDDLPILIDHFVRKHTPAGQKPPPFAQATLRLFEEYRWPGNIRELENEIERLLILGSDLPELPPDLVSSRIQETVQPSTLAFLSSRAAQGNLNDAVEMLERQMISQGLERTGNNKSQLARELGISRSNLILKINKYGLDKPTAPTGSKASA